MRSRMLVRKAAVVVMVQVMLFMMVMLTMPVTPAAHSFAAQASMELQDRFVLKDGRTLVPMRGLLEALGLQVAWDGAAKRVTAGNAEVAIQLTIGSRTALVNGAKRTLDVPAQLIGSRTYVPVRFVSESMEAKVNWDAANRIVHVSHGGAVISIREDQSVLQLGASKSEAASRLGAEKRVTLSRYGFEWNSYHNNYKSYIMFGFGSSGQAVAMYTNDYKWMTAYGYPEGMTRSDVRHKYGSSLEAILKGNTNYRIDSDGEYDVFAETDRYVTVFYDLHDGNKVTAVMWIDKSVEQSLRSFYGKSSAALVKGYELLSLDLANAVRVRMGLAPLTWDAKAAEAARRHSADMMDNGYFSHTGLNGSMPWDRMEALGVTFSSARENIAYGQMDSIFAHEGWMNSLGHRQNLLAEETHLGVGVSIASDGVPYYTQNFFTP